MDYQTRTMTHTLSYTYVDVRHVNWKIRSDLRYLRVMYGIFSEKYEEEMSADLYKWVMAGYVSYIEFIFYSSNMELKLGLKYAVNSGGVVSRDDDAGSIPFVSLPYGIQFQVLVGINDAWRLLTNQQRERFYETLGPGWGNSNLRLTENQSSWASDNIYSSNTLSVRRSIYNAL